MEKLVTFVFFVANTPPPNGVIHALALTYIKIVKEGFVGFSEYRAILGVLYHVYLIFFPKLRQLPTFPQYLPHGPVSFQGNSGEERRSLMLINRNKKIWKAFYSSTGNTRIPLRLKFLQVIHTLKILPMLYVKVIMYQIQYVKNLSLLHNS